MNEAMRLGSCSPSSSPGADGSGPNCSCGARWVWLCRRGSGGGVTVGRPSADSAPVRGGTSAPTDGEAGDAETPAAEAEGWNAGALEVAAGEVGAWEAGPTETAGLATVDAGSEDDESRDATSQD